MHSVQTGMRTSVPVPSPVKVARHLAGGRNRRVCISRFPKVYGAGPGASPWPVENPGHHQSKFSSSYQSFSDNFLGGNRDQALSRSSSSDHQVASRYVRDVPATSQDAGKLVRCKFWLKYSTQFGQSVRIIGSDKTLGAWNVKEAPHMSWSDGNMWNAIMDLPGGQVYEYKYVVIGYDGSTPCAWQNGGNSVLAVQVDDSDIEVFDNWENSPGATVVCGGQQTTRELKLARWASEANGYRMEMRRARIELIQAQEEMRAMREELFKLRTELSLAAKSRLESERLRVEVERENMQLRSQLSQTQDMLKNTMEEAMDMLSQAYDKSQNILRVASSGLHKLDVVLPGSSPTHLDVSEDPVEEEEEEEDYYEDDGTYGGVHEDLSRQEHKGSNYRYASQHTQSGLVERSVHEPSHVVGKWTPVSGIHDRAPSGSAGAPAPFSHVRELLSTPPSLGARAAVQDQSTKLRMGAKSGSNSNELDMLGGHPGGEQETTGDKNPTEVLLGTSTQAHRQLSRVESLRRKFNGHVAHR